MLKKFYGLSSHIIQNSDIHAPFILAYVVTYLTTTLLNLVLFEYVTQFHYYYFVVYVHTLGPALIYVYIFYRFHPSKVCGPFSHYNEKVEDGNAHYYQMFVDDFNESKNINPGFVFAFVVFLW